MFRALLLLFLIFNSNNASSSGALGTGDATARPDAVNIGAIITFDSVVGKNAKIAISIAVEDVNSSPDVLNGTKFTLKMHDSKSTDFLGMIEHALQFMENDTVAIIGPQFSTTARIISHIANELNVPLLSFAATDPTLSPVQFPFLVRTVTSDVFQMKAVADLVVNYQWRDVIAIYVDDDFGRNAIAVLGDKLSEKLCRISYKVPLNPKSTKDVIRKALISVSLMESRILILHIYTSWGLQVLTEAQDLLMLGSGYVWIATEWLSTILDTDPSLAYVATKDIQGVLTFRMYTPDSELKTKLKSRWSNLTRLTRATNGSFSAVGLNAYAICAYDSVWLLAHAIESFFAHKENISFSSDSNLRGLHGRKLRIFEQGSELLRSILEVNTTGVKGPIKFNPDGDLIDPSFEIINVIGTGTRTVGYWSNSSGLSLDPPDKPQRKQHQPDYTSSTSNSTEEVLYNVIWPGQTTEKPRGWVFPENGEKLRIGVPDRVSYPEIVSAKGNEFTGFCIEVFLAALKELPYGVPYKFIPFSNGKSLENPIQLLRRLQAGEIDGLVGDITITNRRTKLADFTQPFIESGLVVVAPVKRLDSNAWAFLRPFTPRMWGVTAMFFLVVGLVVWILERRTNEDFRGPPRKQIITTIWFSFSTLFFAQKERTGSTLGRFVLIIWLFVVLIINSSYIANLTSILTVEQLSTHIKNIESLAIGNDRIGFLNGSFAQRYLNEELDIQKSRLVPLNSPEEYEKALKAGPRDGGVAAVVDERTYMELFLSTRCGYTIVGQEFTKMGWGLAFARDSPLAADMSTAILKLSEKGDLQKIHDKWLMKHACSTEGTKQSVERLPLKSFWGLFLLIGTTCFLALLLHSIEVMRQYFKYSDHPYTSETSPSTRLRSFVSFVNKREREVKSRVKRRRTDQKPSHKIVDKDGWTTHGLGESV